MNILNDNVWEQIKEISYNNLGTYLQKFLALEKRIQEESGECATYNIKDLKNPNVINK